MILTIRTLHQQIEILEKRVEELERNENPKIKALQERIEELEKKGSSVSDLSNRLGKIENLITEKPALALIQKAKSEVKLGDPSYIENWMSLIRGMHKDDVIKRIGKPNTLAGYANRYWSYSNLRATDGLYNIDCYDETLREVDFPFIRFIDPVQNNLIKNNWLKIRKGMTEEAVKYLVGIPSDLMNIGKSSTWSYTNLSTEESALRIEFKGRRVSRVIGMP